MMIKIIIILSVSAVFILLGYAGYAIWTIENVPIIIKIAITMLLIVGVLACPIWEDIKK